MKRILPACLLLAAACGSLGSEPITPTVVRAERSHGGVVAVTARGARNVADEDLAGALRTTLEDSGLFDAALLGERADADWRLSAGIVDLEKPEWDLDMEARVQIRYRLTDAGGATVWSQRIETSHVATPEDAFAFGDRSDLAIGGAVRENLVQALEHLSALDLNR